MNRILRVFLRPIYSPSDLFCYGLAYGLYQEHGLAACALGLSIWIIIKSCLTVYLAKGGTLDD
ncbi:hypothetical protein SAMN05892877_11018 [Rhizobium subbaraonis]|uniref:Uncharacterized protein n=1 Tax=Rhizobium subbaraonis TaxID=908946 RepID=A0A285UPA5_9HYPH|nr:hypothetical protein [Rhizobium subbaraonis]SOC42476.1 hypothetical protein SAMN05892877_11018 [Rhizobium subbaraonis]